MSTDSEGRKGPGHIVEMFGDGRVIVNMGRNAKVSESSRLVVVRDYDELEDPDSGESLGRIMNPKVDLAVHSVDERFCVTYPVVSFADTLRGALPFLKQDRSRVPQVGDEVVFSDDWGV